MRGTGDTVPGCLALSSRDPGTRGIALIVSVTSDRATLLETLAVRGRLVVPLELRRRIHIDLVLDPFWDSCLIEAPHAGGAASHQGRAASPSPGTVVPGPERVAGVTASSQGLDNPLRGAE